MKPFRICSRPVRTAVKALLCASASAEAASKQPPSLALSGFKALSAGKQPNGDKLRKANFLPPFSYKT